MTVAALESFGRLDILVNNAGINTRGPIDELTYEQFREVQDINVDGIWLCCRAVLPSAEERRRRRGPRRWAGAQIAGVRRGTGATLAAVRGRRVRAGERHHGVLAAARRLVQSGVCGRVC